MRRSVVLLLLRPFVIILPPAFCSRGFGEAPAPETVFAVLVIALLVKLEWRRLGARDISLGLAFF